MGTARTFEHAQALCIAALFCGFSCSLDRNGRAAAFTEVGAVDSTSDGAHVDAAPVCSRQTSFCNAGTLYECINGRGRVLDACDLGCVMAENARCGTLRPSNYSGTNPWSGTLDVIVAAGELWVLNSDTDAIERRNPSAPQDITSRIDGPQAGAEDDGNYTTFRVRSLRVDANGTLLVRGSKPVIVLAAQSVVIEGRVVAGDFDIPIDGLLPAGAGAGGVPMEFRGGFLHGRAGTGAGAGGGGQQGTAQSQIAPPPSRDGGGGGGGFGTPGGAGGSSDVALRGNAGASYGIESLEPMSAGSGGGSGADDTTGPGGVGGGAVQISAQTTITIAATGVVDSGGAGGANGGIANGNAGGGSGGGSGGAILLEAITVDVRGHISVMGGGGGGAASADGGNATAGSAGQSGRFTPSLSSMGADGGIGGGGRGSRAEDGQASPGESANGSANGGGGGGGAGRIRINSNHGARVLQSSDRFLPLPGSGLVTVGGLMSQ